MQNIKDMEKELAELELQKQVILDKLDKAKKEVAKLTPEQRIAVMLHEATCSWNHIDGCGWHYEYKNSEHDWNGSAHSLYREKAVKLIREAGSVGEAERYIRIYQKVKAL